MYNHDCIKCKAKYQDSDPDAYLCSACFDAKKAIAAEVDAKMASRPKLTVKSDLQEFEENGVKMNVGGRVVTFMKA
jgi:hypothetical protein